MDICLTINRGNKEFKVKYQKVKLGSMDDKWLVFQTQGINGKKTVYMPKEWITHLEILPDEEEKTRTEDV